MKAVIQRCRRAQVEVEGKVVGAIEQGLVIFLGVAQDDDESCALRLAKKIALLRIFDDADGKFNFSLLDISGSVLIISNFTLFGETRKATRPDFRAAAPSRHANRLYECFAKLLSEQNIVVQTGIFAASMEVTVVNDGPVTLILEVANPPSPPVDSSIQLRSTPQFS